MNAQKDVEEKRIAEGGRLGREVFGLCFVFCGLLFILSLLTFDSRDPWINHSLSNITKIHNKAGEFGAFLSGSLFDVLGMGAWVIPVFFCLVGARRIVSARPWAWWRWCGFILLTICICFVGAAGDLGATEIFRKGVVPQGGGDVSSHGGGILGHMLYVGLVGWMSTTGAFLVWLCFLLLAVQMLVGFSLLALLKALKLFLLKTLDEVAIRIHEKQALRRQEHLARVERNAGESLTLAVEALPVYDQRERDDCDFDFSPAPDDKSSFFGDPERSFADKEPPIPYPDHPPHYPSDAARIAAPGASGQKTLIHPALLQGHAAENQGKNETPAHPGNEEGALYPSGRMGERKAFVPENDEDLLQALWRSAEAKPGSTGPGGEVWEREGREPKPLGRKGEEGSFPAKPDNNRDAAADDDAGADSVPIYQAPDVEAAPLQRRPGFVSSVMQRIKQPAHIPLPGLNLLQPAPPVVGGASRAVLEEKGRNLMTCLHDFGIQGELVGITPGPVVTMFEVRPAPGVRVSRIANLSDDLALTLKAVAVRIQAPVPGTDTVGIEIPNDTRETVCLKELLGSQLFNRSQSLLTLALGKDIAGSPAVADLAAMPHLLVAGATGAGKSVGINSIILSLLYKARPHEVKLLLIDPKRVEMAIYADLPHLVHPVVTEMPLAKNALDWAVAEMEQRYTAIARAGVRNITDYNAKLASLGDQKPQGLEDLEPIPYLVIIIDELADLMLVAAKEVETSIVRLAQLARAAGIHLILATQRPSVDVVTGLIKANFPCRISFQVTSKHDSRTILDAVGAEHLLGRGDMLFKPSGGKFQRLHGAFVSDKNVHAVVEYWKSRQKPSYQIDFADWSADGAAQATGGNGIGNSDVAADPLYGEAVEFVRQQGKASISLIQRKFRIGFNKAARFVEQMEQDGVIGAADGSKPRMVIR